MEKLNDILSNLKERFTNPLIFSFIFSWLVFNWEITIALLWNFNQDIVKEGFDTIFSFIGHKLNSPDSLYYPLIFSITYTFGFPILKNIIQAFYSWTSRWGESWNLKILDTGKISIRKYINLKMHLDKRTKELEEILEKESLLSLEKAQKENELLHVKRDLNKTIEELSKYQRFKQVLYDISILNGTWENNYKFPDGRSGSEHFYIFNGAYYKINDFGQQEYTFDLVEFSYDTEKQHVFFIKQSSFEKKEEKKYDPNVLRFEGRDLLIGYENRTTEIRYKRK